MLALMRHYLWIALPALVLAASCEDKSAEKKPAAAAPAVSSAAPPVDEQPEPRTVSDFDTKHFREQFKCPNKANKGICDVLDGFDEGTAWKLTRIRGKEARYFGKAVLSSGGEIQEAWVFLVARKVPLNEVTEGDLPLQIALRTLDESNEAVKNHTERLLRKLQRDDAVTKRNQTANHVLDYAPSNWDSAAETKGESIILHIDGGAYVRQGKGRSLYLVKVEAAKPGSSEADGMFVRLYPLLW